MAMQITVRQVVHPNTTTLIANSHPQSRHLLVRHSHILKEDIAAAIVAVPSGEALSQLPVEDYGALGLRTHNGTRGSRVMDRMMAAVDGRVQLPRHTLGVTGTPPRWVLGVRLVTPQKRPGT